MEQGLQLIFGLCIFAVVIIVGISFLLMPIRISQQTKLLRGIRDEIRAARGIRPEQ
jgi:Ca2+/Na+ antiporter